MALSSGRRLGHYAIEHPLGSGGMGEVYAAQDLHLRRRVAVKILNADASAPEVQRRLRKEAETVAALNHPNIVTIYAFEQDGPVAFIAMELIEGHSLRALIDSGPVPTVRVLAIVGQAIDAVAAAHDKGILHRDIKPANVMVTSDGRVKVLDFGIAKTVDASRSATHATMTASQAGIIVGSGPYMSPEQARGDAVDYRADIFAIGVTMFELLTGHRPFDGRTPADVASAILTKPVTFPRPATALEAEVHRVIARCLEKDPADRYQTIRDLGADVRRAMRQPEPAVSIRRGWSRAAAALALAAAPAWWLWSQPTADPAAISLGSPRQITTAQGAELDPSWSPDGTRVAYHLDGDIWVSQLNGAAVNLTNSPNDRDRLPAWSPDGSQIGFVSGADGGGLFVVSAVGGPVRKVVGVEERSSFSTRGAWSADSKRFAVAMYDRDRRSRLTVVSLADGVTSHYPLSGIEPSTGQDLAWSPDGNWMAYIDATAPLPEQSTLYIQRLGDAAGTPLTDGRALARSPQFSADGATLFYVSNHGGSSDLWAQPLTAVRRANGPPRRVTTGVGMSSFAFTASGDKLAYSRGRETIANVWRAPLVAGRELTWGDATQLTFDDALVEFIDVTKDGTTLFLSSDRRGNQDLWSMPAGGGEMRQLTIEPSPDWRPTLAPDARHVVFYSYRSGHRDLWRMAADGRDLRQLSTGREIYHPAWSPDGQRIAYVSIVSGTRRIEWMPLAGGEPVALGEPGDNYPTWSPDGSLLAVRRTLANTSQIVIITPQGQERYRFDRRGRVGRPIWFDSRFLVYPTTTAIRALEPLTGRDWQIADFSSRRGAVGDYSLASDGRFLYFSWQTPFADIWAMDVTRR